MTLVDGDPQSSRHYIDLETVQARGFILILLGLALLLIGPESGQAAQLPTLPQIFVDTTYSPPSGNSIAVNAGGDFQAALNIAVPGDTIVLEAGATFAGPFTLPEKAGSGWIYIRSSAYASLPLPGTRVSQADAVNMPKITVISGAGAAIRTDTRAHHYRFVGIEFKPDLGTFVFDLIRIGNDEASLADLPHDITFDRCYIHGDPTVGSRRGVSMNGISVAVIDSYVSDFKEIDSDTQALWAFNTPGPLKIVNNYLEASGENVMTGGTDPRITNLVPSDIEIRRNHFFKPLAWISEPSSVIPWTVKNLMEFKMGQRVLVEGNLFENNWQSGQGGEGIVITPRNRGTAPWSVTQDITIRLNKIINVGSGINLSGRDDVFQSQITQRVLIENNVINVTALQGAAGRIFQIFNGPIDATIRHNTGFTIITNVSASASAYSENDPLTVPLVVTDRFDFRDNLLSKGEFGFTGSGTGEGTPTLDAFYTNYTFLKNAIIGEPSGLYPNDNFFPADTGTVQFVDFAGGNYRLSASSPFKNAATDGMDLGADIGAIETAMEAGKSYQSLNFISTAPVGATVGGAPYSVTASSSSGLPVVLTIDAAAGAVCTIAGGTVSFIGAGSCVINANQAGDANYNAAAPVQQSFAVAAVPNTLAARFDFNADSKADILWRNEGLGGTGENYLYPMDGTTILGTEGYPRTVVDLNWQVVGIGDFDGDGKADILWRNIGTGENYVYIMDGTTIASEGYLRTVAQPDWQVAGVGDFDGDGKDDILWRNAVTGENYLYPMDGLTILGTEGYLRTVADTSWMIAGVGDVDGDGKADVLWRNSSTGQNYLYPMDGTTIKPTEGYLRTVADQHWQVAGLGDYDGDSKADVLWRNEGLGGTGENYLYFMNGTTIAAEGYVRTVTDLAWQVKGTGDYDGDGKADVLWRNSVSGENYLYPMDGTTIKPTEGYLRTVPQPNWQIQNPK